MALSIEDVHDSATLMSRICNSIHPGSGTLVTTCFTTIDHSTGELKTKSDEAILSDCVRTLRSCNNDIPHNHLIGEIDPDAILHSIFRGFVSLFRKMKVLDENGEVARHALAILKKKKQDVRKRNLLADIDASWEIAKLASCNTLPDLPFEELDRLWSLYVPNVDTEVLEMSALLHEERRLLSQVEMIEPEKAKITKRIQRLLALTRYLDEMQRRLNLPTPLQKLRDVLIGKSKHHDENDAVGSANATSQRDSKRRKTND